MRSAIICDVHNLYLGCTKKYPGMAVDYSAVTKLFTDSFGIPFFKIAYGRQSEDKVESFAKMLKRIGYDVRFGGGPYNVEMALEVASMIERRAIDHLVLGTNYFEAGRILNYARERGIHTTAFGFGLPTAFANICEPIELDTEFLLERVREVPSEESVETVATVA